MSSTHRRRHDAIRQSQRQRSKALLDGPPNLTCMLGTDVARRVLLGIPATPF